MDNYGQECTLMDTDGQQWTSKKNDEEGWMMMDINGQRWTTMDNNEQ